MIMLPLYFLALLVYWHTSALVLFSQNSYKIRVGTYDQEHISKLIIYYLLMISSLLSSEKKLGLEEKHVK